MNDAPLTPEATAALRKLRRLAAAIAKGEALQQRRLAERYDLAKVARDGGARWPVINAAAGVRNMQATVNGKRPEA
jgi:hypothetical protein